MTRIARITVCAFVATAGSIIIAGQGPGQAHAQAAAQRAAPSQSVQRHVPSTGTWERRDPAQVGMNAALLAEAVEYAKTRDTAWGKTDYMADQVRTFGKPLGPVPQSHGPTNGIVIRHGYVVAEFGDTNVVEPTYSVAKSYLSTVLGLTLGRGMIKRVTDRVGDYIKDGGYDSPHNAQITWEHHARQTSEWEGELFGRQSTFIGHDDFGNGEMKPRAIREPGSYYEYNDVRVNRLSLSLLRLWKRPLPDVLKTEIMDPIGASNSWRWIGYDNADVQVDGKMMKSVPGGTRWGGGLWMSTRDHARFGLLMARQGNWNGKQLVPAEWIARATTPGGPSNAPDYGYLWWLNSRGATKGNPTTAYEARGNGSNTIFIDLEHDLVVVWRWHAGGDFFARVVASITDTTTQ